jgi:hypothetical protein
LVAPTHAADADASFPHRVFAAALTKLETIMKGYALPEDQSVYFTLQPPPALPVVFL